MTYNKTLKTEVHYCGDGYKGKVIESKKRVLKGDGTFDFTTRVVFCSLCGKTFNNEAVVND